MEGMDAVPRNRRTRLRVLDKDLQFHTLKVALLFSAGLAVILVTVVYGIERKILGTGLHNANVLRAVSWLYAVNAVFVLATGLLVGLYSAIHSHRVAGPAYRLGRVARQMAGGDFSEPIHLRRGDYLTALAAEMEAMRQRIVREERRRRDAVGRLRALAARAPDEGLRREIAGAADGMDDAAAAGRSSAPGAP